ncbi:MAG TPA: biosynthetic peptidoglycan transglycosylase, partial [Candidatus Eisenbacteria bacterium]
PGAAGPASPRVRAAAAQLAEALLLPARRLPELRLTDLDLQRGDSAIARIDALSLMHRAGGVQLAAAGMIESERRVSFDVVLDWGEHDRLVGRATFHVPDATRGNAALELRVDGHVTQDRRAGVVRVAEGTRVQVGRATLRVAGEVGRAGPHLDLGLEVDGLTARDVQRSLPPAVLGPLADLTVRGSWDWRASLHVNVARPDSTRFRASVIPHGLQLGPDGARLRLGALAGPFLAEIHVPRDRVVLREMSGTNPHFRTLDRISPLLRDALLTNEDGGFYHHRGFNAEAIQLAMAANLRTGSFRRGAGTITMQLARNLFLGHQRTLSRKGQEVVLAWVLEHLTGLSKDRLLEIYLNIIEWGPGVHGADEAARFYFDEDAADLTLDEALFLTVVVPSPSHWKNRLDATGDLRPWARSQMAYIARKMVTRGWLAPERVPDAESLHVHLRGAAAQAFAPRDSTAARPNEPI